MSSQTQKEFFQKQQEASAPAVQQQSGPSDDTTCEQTASVEYEDYPFQKDVIVKAIWVD